MSGIIYTWPQFDITHCCCCIKPIVSTLLGCALFNSLKAVFVWNRYIHLITIYPQCINWTICFPRRHFANAPKSWLEQWHQFDGADLRLLPLPLWPTNVKWAIMWASRLLWGHPNWCFSHPISYHPHLSHVPPILTLEKKGKMPWNSFIINLEG